MVQEGNEALEGMCNNITSHRPCMDSHNLFICLSGRSLLTGGKSRIRTPICFKQAFLFIVSICIFL